MPFFDRLIPPIRVATPLLGCLFSLLVLTIQAFGVDFSKLEQSMLARFGPGSTAILKDWQKTMTDSRNLSETEKVKRINGFFNRHIRFEDDSQTWGQADYWATPIETMGKGQGDCEDFSIAKYYSLMELGIPVAKLRMVYVKARQMGPAGPVIQAHMVLAYYPTPTADPLVLDNLNPEIRPASTRSDLTPIFSFNSQGIWHGTGNQAGNSNLSRWQDLLQRAHNEGFQ